MNDYAQHEHHEFLDAADQALHDAPLQAALIRLTGTLMAGNRRGFAALADSSSGAEEVNVSIYDLVRQAVLNKDIVVATYQGHRREMCPHVLGTKDRRRQGLFYQFGGTSFAIPGYMGWCALIFAARAAVA